MLRDTEGRVLGAIGGSGDTSYNNEGCALLAIESHGLVGYTVTIVPDLALQPALPAPGEARPVPAARA